MYTRNFDHQTEEHQHRFISYYLNHNQVFLFMTSTNAEPKWQ